jgi:two-component system chemotaxis response regulator CheB
MQLARRPFSMRRRGALIGSSTGGPQALMTLVADIGPVIDCFPVLITQHAADLHHDSRRASGARDRRPA